jgi:hypothetical protein
MTTTTLSIMTHSTVILSITTLITTFSIRALTIATLGIMDLMEQHTLKNVNNCMNINIYSYLETSGGQSSYPYLNDVHFLNTKAV